MGLPSNYRICFQIITGFERLSLSLKLFWSVIFDGDLHGRFAIINDNNITISNMTIKEYGTANSCTSNCGGGAILVNENKYGFIINDVIFDGNITDGTSGDGGAIEVLSGSSSSLNSTIFKKPKP